MSPTDARSRMMRTMIRTALAAVATAVGACAHARYTGLDSLAVGGVQPADLRPGVQTPDGYVSLGGSMIGGAGGEHSFELYRRRDTTIAVLARLVSRDDKGVPTFVTEAALRLPPLKRGESYIEGDCYSGGRLEPGLLAIGRWRRPAPPDTARDIRAAWRPNIRDRRIDTVSTQLVSCHISEDRRE